MNLKWFIEFSSSKTHDIEMLKMFVQAFDKFAVFHVERWSNGLSHAAAFPFSKKNNENVLKL